MADTKAPIGDDLSALAWVHGELRRSLENAHKSLRRHLKEADAIGNSDVDAVDPSVLRAARTQIHQGVGALELVGLPTVAQVLRASEAAVQRLASRPASVDAAAIDVIERVSFAVLDFLARQLAHKPVSPVLLFPQYRAAQQLAAADRVHPADLWPLDFQWHELAHEGALAPRAGDDAARGEMESLVLALMRGGDANALERTSDFCAQLAAGAAAEGVKSAQASRYATSWQLAAAFFQAQSRGLLASDVYTKRIASRLLAQLRLHVRGSAEVSDRLAQDLLFFCAHAAPPGADHPAPRVAAVRRAWRLDEHPSAPDYETPRLGRFDPAVIALAKKRVGSAKEAWSGVAGGEMHRAASLGEQVALVGDSLTRLFPQGDVLAQALSNAAAMTVTSGQAPAAPLAMEVATAILYVDASIEDGDLDHPELGERITRLASRIDDVRIGASPAPLEAWMEELYRRVSDRQTMGSVVQELRSTLSEVEKQIDQYFRNPAERQVLIPVPGQLQAMRGVLSVLGMEQASMAVLHMQGDIDALAATEVDPQRAIAAGSFDRVADNLGALSFLIDMLSVQPALAKSLFKFDPKTGSLSALVGQSERTSVFSTLDEAKPATAATQPSAAAPLHERAGALAAAAARADVPDSDVEKQLESLAQQALAAEQPALARTANAATAAMRGAGNAAQRSSVRQDLAQALAAFAPHAEAKAPAAPLPPAKTTAPATPGSTGLEDDAEMREIFIEEAREVIGDARSALERLADMPDNVGELTAVRRAFHTLKGSSRMIGLRNFGDAGWACEQLYNARLASAPRLDKPLEQFSLEALDYLGHWVEAIAAGRDDGHVSAAVAKAADTLRESGVRLPIVPAAAVISTTRPGALPSVEATITELRAPQPEAPAPAEYVVDSGPLLDELPQTAVEMTMPFLRPPIERPAPDVLPSLPPLEAFVLDSGKVVTPPPPPSAQPPQDFEFELDLTDPDSQHAPLQAEAPRAPADDLTVRVPGLPSAADLELRLPSTAATPAAEAPPPSFELDLRALDAAADTPPPPPEELPLAAPVGNAKDLPLPDTLELDSSLAATAFGDDMPARAEPVDEQVKLIGPLRISIPLFNIFLNEADELSRRLATEIAEWSVDPLQHPVPEHSVALAHSLAGNSATVGYQDLSTLARSLEHALERSRTVGHGRPGEAALFGAAAEQIRHLLHQFAAGFLRPVPAELTKRLADHERWGEDDGDASPAPIERTLSDPALHETATDRTQTIEPMAQTIALGAPAESQRSAVERGANAAVPVVDSVAVGHISAFTPLDAAGPAAPHARADAFDDDEDIEAEDAVDAELFPIFEEEGAELLPQLQNRLREWHDHPSDGEAATSCMRTLHTFKGGARLAGAMRLGEMAHRLETAIEHLSAHEAVSAAQIEPLLARSDAMAMAFDRLRKAPLAAAPAAPSVEDEAAPVPVEAPPEPAVAEEPVSPVEATVPLVEQRPLEETNFRTQPFEGRRPALKAVAPPVATVAPAGVARSIDWSRFALGSDATKADPLERQAAAGGAAVRVRAGLLDRLVNQAGEVSITRERIASDMKQLQGSLGELTDSLDRMRKQLRDIELQAETQISSRMEAARGKGQDFDPLEMDRFTRFQELTRFMAESVNDVATLQRSLQRTLQSTEDELASQARLTRELQDDLLRTRMVEFESMSDRLYRTVRQAAKETGKQVRLDISGGAIEIDRGVLERMAGPFEHLLRNSVVHGIENADRRIAAGKDAGGRIAVQIAQSGNEVAVEFADDGGGFDYERIRRRGLERNLISPEKAAAAGEAELAQLLFTPGFSTAESVTELAGRGVGLDVVRAEVNAMGGRIETTSAPGQGTRFRLLLPLTTAVTQVVMLRCGTLQIAVPSTLVELVRRVPATELERAYNGGTLEHGGEVVPFFWLAALLQAGTRGAESTRAQTVVIIRSAAQRVAVHVDEVVGNQEVVVKNVGPQLARLPGLAGVTLLPSGAVALIYNPVALATLYADSAREAMRQAGAPAAKVTAAAAASSAPMVLVVDDSLTVRRVTQRLLVREGYRVVTAKDGLDALEKLAEERPVVLLSDIEMPRMDGFDLVRNVRADERLADLPVVMITSRIAQKHRDYAAELGVDHYLGKPYSEEELLSLVARYAGADIAT